MQSRTNGGSGVFPQVQAKTGYGSAEAGNPKVTRRKDSGGPVAGAGGAANTANYAAGKDGSAVVSADGYPGSDDPNTFNRGTGATEPGPNNINRGYSDINSTTVPTVTSVTSANRDNYGFDPGALSLAPAGNTDDTPSLPSYGVGTTGD